eukprot:CAMPEP_0204436526 /NCGR_PEP_ID=MMETSP0470-20130426/75675_1 /ASSEMBLY_ACC=CAM_ASM_000385 /TAXON_ID=2969 /ORGANISM="Oxyrrhis marina" /LENGTH=180 /DNA_ID=CAMNT_0051435187 /DNA_START=28 /DNA_END=566 /DNA_ORIENTATION=-
MVLEAVLVTGGQGFFGAWIMKDLLSRPECKRVALLDLRPAVAVLEQILTKEELARVETHYTDIADLQKVQGVIAAFKPTAVIHLAGMQIPLVKAAPDRGGSVNVVGTINVLEALKPAAEAGSPVPLVYASSAAVLGPAEDYKTFPVPDDHNHQPRTLYGVTKLANEGSARIFWQDYKVPS